MKTLFIIGLLLCYSCNHDYENEELESSKRKCVIILQRKAMKKLYPREILEDWTQEAESCTTIYKADSLYNALLERAVNAEFGSYGVVHRDNADELYIRTRVKK